LILFDPAGNSIAKSEPIRCDSLDIVINWEYGSLKSLKAPAVLRFTLRHACVVLQMKAYELLGNPGLRQGDVVEFILDDSKKQKRGKAMEAVNWIRDPLTGRNIRGHQYVRATIRFRGHTIPFGIHLYI